MSSESPHHELAEIEARGFVVLRELLSRDELAAIRSTLEPFLERGRSGRPALGRNNFEGFATQRVYSLVARGEVFERLAEHPRILSICDALLAENYLLTASQAIEIHPGETEQPFHTDDTFYGIPRPRRAVSVSTIFAVDEFSLENGGTEVVPGSHLWTDDQIGEFLRELPGEFQPASRGTGQPRPAGPLPASLEGRVETILMPPGSVVVFLGTLLHRGGANRSRSLRLGFSNQYCQPWARPQENFFLSIDRAQVAGMSHRLQALLGYSIHPPFMGHVAGIHPLRTLTRKEPVKGVLKEK